MMTTLAAISSSFLPVSEPSTLALAQQAGQSQSSASAQDAAAPTQSTPLIGQNITPAIAEAMLPDDTYTSGGQTIVEPGNTLGNAILNLSALYTASSSGSAGASSGNQTQSQNINVLAAEELAKNQVISDDSNVRQVLIGAIGNDPVGAAWGQLNSSVFAGDLSGAQTALTNYTQALQNSNYDMSSLTAPTAKFMSELSALGTAIQGGDLSQVKTAYLAAQHDAPDNVGGAFAVASESGDTAAMAGVAQEAVANMTDNLTALGYTSANAAIEANIIEIGGDVQDQVADPGQASVQQSVIALAKVAAEDAPSLSGSSTTTNPSLSIYTAILGASTTSAMSKALATLDSTYGINTSDNSMSTSVNTYA